MIRYRYKFTVGKNKSHSVILSARDKKEADEMIEKIIRGNPDYPKFSKWKLIDKEYISDFAYSQY